MLDFVSTNRRFGQEENDEYEANRAGTDFPACRSMSLLIPPGVGRLDTPVGPIEVSVNEDGAVVRVSFAEDDANAAGTTDKVCAAAVRQLEEYFSGERRSFDVELDPEGSDFEKRVWEKLLLIPYGATTTYGEIARKLGDPGASRAVGLANARNPVAIIIPCHRVIGADGDLTGYAGGMHRKRWLLAHESGQASLGFEDV
jgi:methylated-DNA-[protein]-cysteine S-methyltransferase